MASRRVLNQQADRIEAVLQSHKVPAQVYGGTVTPRLVRFNLMIAPHIKLSKLLALSEELALAIGAVSCRIQRQKDVIQIEVPREDGAMVTFAQVQSMVRRAPALTAILGTDAAGQPLLLRLSSPSVAHVLVSGTTGSGKTALMRTLLYSLTQHNRPADMGFTLIDPKGRSFAAFATQRQLLLPIAHAMDAAIGVLTRIEREMERRDAEGFCRPHIIVAIDELADLLQSGRDAAARPLLRLLQRGREAGIHVIACTQKPSATVLDGLMLANFPTRLVGKVASANDARVASGIAGTGAEKLMGRGEFMLVALGQVIRFQAAWLSAAEMVSHHQDGGSDE